MNSIPLEIGPYRVLEPIGEGGSATVYKARHNPTGMIVAMKILSKSTVNALSFRREIEIMRSINHPYIVSFFELVEDANNYYVIEEYALYGSILEYINRLTVRSESVVRKIFIQIIVTIRFLHNEKNIAHRDLKPENILLDKNDNIKIIDFGLSSCYSDDKPYLNTQCGSPSYLPPEVISHKKYTSAVDIWSIGVLLYTLITGKLPFYDQNVHNMFEMILNSDPVIPRTFSSSLSDLMRKLLDKNPDTRITIPEILDHEWVKNSKERIYALEISNFQESCNLLTFDDQLDERVIKMFEQRQLNYDNLLYLIKSNKFNDPLYVSYKIMHRCHLINVQMSVPKTLLRASKTISRIRGTSDQKTPFYLVKGNRAATLKTQTIRRPNVKFGTSSKVFDQKKPMTYPYMETIQFD